MRTWNGWAVAAWCLALWGCSRSEVTHEITVTERPVAAVVDVVKPVPVVPLGEEVRVCAETGGEACERLLGRRAEVEAGGEVSKQAWVEALAAGCLQRADDEFCRASIAVMVEVGAVPEVGTRCGSGEWRACALLGEVHAARVASRQNTGEQEVEHRTAASYLEKACSPERRAWCGGAMESFASSARLASLHGARDAVASDLERIARIGGSFCLAGDDAVCMIAVLALVSDELGEAERNFGRARELAKTCCDEVRKVGARVATTCTTWAEMALLGLGGERDVSGGVRLFEELCAREVVDDATETACRSMAFLHTGRMEILPVDAVKARGYAKRACEVLAKLRADADCFVAREVEELLGEGAPRAVVEP